MPAQVRCVSEVQRLIKLVFIFAYCPFLYSISLFRLRHSEEARQERLRKRFFGDRSSTDITSLDSRGRRQIYQTRPRELEFCCFVLGRSTDISHRRRLGKAYSAKSHISTIRTFVSISIEHTKNTAIFKQVKRSCFFNCSSQYEECTMQCRPGIRC